LANMRKTVALGPGGVIFPGTAQDFRAYGNEAHIAHSTVRSDCVRFWAHWPTMQAENPGSPGTGLHPMADPVTRARVLALDAQAYQVFEQGLGVVITALEFPQWCNGTQGVDPATFMLEHRQTPGSLTQPKGLTFRWPLSLAPDSPWAYWIYFLATRYHPSNTTVNNDPNSLDYRPIPGRAHAIEFCNEPNRQCWPLLDSADNLTAHCQVYQMFQTAPYITQYAGYPILCGPGTADHAGATTKIRVNYLQFHNSLAWVLAANSFDPQNRFIWSVHNYSDVEYNRGQYSLTNNFENSVSKTLEQLQSFWTGWPGANPYTAQIWITEGGARTDVVEPLYAPFGWNKYVAQRETVYRNFHQMRAIPQVGMWTNYLGYSDPDYDSGLFKPHSVSQPDEARTVFRDFWDTAPRYGT
jgi:hypothetical protein